MEHAQDDKHKRVLDITPACVECRRLKRKCNREHPCDVCTRHGKLPCVYPSESRRGIRPRDDEGENTEDVDAVNKRRRTGSPASSPATTPFSNSNSNQMPTFVPSPSPFHRAPSQDANARYSVASESAPRVISPTTTTEALEKQPRVASGYEWNERHQTALGGKDGTASLSLEPDGEGYLGFASGATLLRILQLCAGAIFLPHFSINGDFGQISTANTPPSSQDMETYIDAYFKLYHVQYPMVHEPTFRAQWNEIIPNPPKYQWDLLVNVVLGIGAFCSFQSLHVIDYFLERAISGIRVDHLESGSLTLVQAFTLLSNLAQKRNKPNSGSVYLGIAVRMAIALGLHRELPGWDISPFDRETRRRVWWVVYCFDSGACITFGRPVLLPEKEADVNLVLNVNDRAFTPVAASIPPASSEPTMYTSLLYQSSFHRVGNQCYNAVISTSPLKTAKEVLLLDKELQVWHATIPQWMDHNSTKYPYLSFSTQKLFWRYSNLRIILHRRAFLERALKGLPLWKGLLEDGRGGVIDDADVDVYCSELCLESASLTISTIQRFFGTRPPNRLEWWYGLHFLFHASFVPLVALHTDHFSPRRPSWKADVDAARSTLNTLKDDPLAERCLQIVDLLSPASSPSAEASSSTAHLDQSLVAQLLQSTTSWSANPDFAQNWLPFADFTSLSEFWPTNEHH